MSEDVAYFSDPQLDRVVGLVWQLAAELHVADHRCRALEALLVRHGALAEGELDGFVPEGEEGAWLDGARDGRVRRLLRVVGGDGPPEHPLRDEAPGAEAQG